MHMIVAVCLGRGGGNMRSKVMPVSTETSSMTSVTRKGIADNMQVFLMLAKACRLLSSWLEAHQAKG